MADQKPVTLVYPDGREYTSSDPVEISNLQFGLGCTIKSEKSAAKADAPKEGSK